MIKFFQGTEGPSGLLSSALEDTESVHNHAILASLQPAIDALPNEYTGLVHRLFLSPAASGRRLIAFVAVDGHAEATFVCAQAARLLTYRTGHSASVLDITGEVPVIAGASPRQMEHRQTEYLRKLRLDNLRGAAEDMSGGLWVISGAERRKELSLLVGSSELHGLIRELRDQFYYGLIVCPPFASMIGSVALCAECDAVVLVIGTTSKRSVAVESAKLLRSLEVPIAGAVMSGRLK